MDNVELAPIPRYNSLHEQITRFHSRFWIGKVLEDNFTELDMNISRSAKQTPLKIALGGMAFGLFCLGVSVGVIWATSYGNGNQSSPQLTPVSFFPDSAVRSKNLSMATGLISDDVEGLFVLDHLTGNLNCMVLNPRTGKAGALYTTNVFAGLGITKEGADFVMTTGRINVPGSKGNQAPALCVVYVGDSNTGKVVGYSLFYNRAKATQGGQQGGTFTVVFAGQTRGETVDRDQ